MMFGAGFVVVSCLVPDVELVESLPGKAGSASGAGKGGAGGSSAVAGSSGNSGAGKAGAKGGDGAGGTSATEGGTGDTLAGAGSGSSGDGNVPLDDTALSCNALSKTACRGESCCATLPVPGCTDCDFPLGNSSSISPFRLDKYEVTVGRFRAFVEAYEGPPTPGAGAHPMIEGSGWQPTWDGNMFANSAELVNAMQFRPCTLTAIRTWTNEPGEQEQKPANCLTWYEAFAFCAWDGGFLPTEMEWQFAAVGGDEHRKYAWGSSSLDIEHALYGACNKGTSTVCDQSSILEVGSKPLGVGRWGHLDLTGSVWEWILDSQSSAFPAEQPCSDCASLGVSSYRGIRGGSWPEDESYMPADRRQEDGAGDSWYNVGIRCAYEP